MKISILLTDGAKQIMMTPETEHERQALKMIAPGETLNVVTKMGTFGNKQEHVNYQIEECQGGYYRPFPTEESLMFVIKDSPKKPDASL